MIREAMRRHSVRTCVLAASLVLVAAQALVAQERASTEGRWLPREVRPNSSLTPAQLAEANAFFDRVERVLKQVPELATPDAYEILPIVGGGMRQEAPGFEGERLPNAILEYELHLGFYVPTRASGGERTTCITVTVNDPQQARLKDAQGPRASGWGLTADSTPPNWRVLTPNNDFYRIRRSPLEVRSITVRLGIASNCLAPRVQSMIWKLYHTLDWAAFNQMLEQPR